MNKEAAIKKMNQLGKKRMPFFFTIDYSMTDCIVVSPEKAFKEGIFFNFNGIKNYPENWDHPQSITLSKNPIAYPIYHTAFEKIIFNLKKGNTYLVNLTFPTPIASNHNLKQIFHSVQAKYRLLNKNQFVVFSPESFVKIIENKISTYPMKGTIDATIDKARSKLLNDQKKQAEHATIVDLLRNDLSQIATNVNVEKYRYIDEISTSDKQLLQVSSKISGLLPDNYRDNIGKLLFKMLPAGSITGAPKKKTMEIIENTETYQRAFYSGVSGYFDGENLDSCVNIRYIENNKGQLIYKSGGGITSQSNPKDEYQELIDKIYVPFN